MLNILKVFFNSLSPAVENLVFESIDFDQKNRNLFELCSAQGLK